MKGIIGVALGVAVGLLIDRMLFQKFLAGPTA
jgi:uncharacterized membrane protein